MDYQEILYSVEDHVLTLTLNRPQKLNAFTGTMMFELIAAFDEADAANDAASGFNGQRIAIDRTAGGKFYGFIHPATTGRFFEVALLVGWNGTYSAPDAVSVDLSVTDGTTTVTSPDMEIPRAFQGSAYPAHWPGTGSAGGSLWSIFSAASWMTPRP